MRKIRVILLTAIAVIFVSGLIKINIINTKAFSERNSSLNEININNIKEDFGSEFSKFIQDKSKIKIYETEGESCILEVNDQQYKVDGCMKGLTNLKDGVEGIYQNVKSFF